MDDEGKCSSAAIDLQHEPVNISGESAIESGGEKQATLATLEQQLQAWRENPTWTDSNPDVRVTVPKGSLCNLTASFLVGLPPEAVFNIITDPGNKRVFKSIKEVLSRKVLLDEGHRQLVEVEQSAIWRFLWWSGTFSVFVLVDQNREDLTMTFRQTKLGFMKKFQGSWKIESFVDEGRVASKVRLEQLIQPSVVPPPPFSWYVRGITTKAMEMVVKDLLAEAARIREGAPALVE